MDSKKFISNLQEWLHISNDVGDVDTLQPSIPPELFSTDQMENHGFMLALSHKLTHKSVPDMLLKRLSQSESTLTKIV